MLPSWCNFYPNCGWLGYPSTWKPGHRPELAMILPYRLCRYGLEAAQRQWRKSVAGTCGISQALSPVISGSVCQGDYFQNTIQLS